MTWIHKPALRKGILALALCLPAPAQEGSNLDPPAPPVTYEDTGPGAPATPPLEPFWRRIDFADPRNLVKIALLLGSILLARRAFRDMQ